MSNVKIYHNPRCSKSRQALQIIKDRGIEPKVIEYLKEPLEKSELENIAKSLGMRPKEFVRKNEAEFKDNNLAGKLEKDGEHFLQKISKMMLTARFHSTMIISNFFSNFPTF